VRASFTLAKGKKKEEYGDHIFHYYERREKEIYDGMKRRKKKKGRKSLSFSE